MILYENKEFYSVFEINDYIKSLFDNTIILQNIGIIGEISNFRGVNRAGHLYFNIKDEKSSLNCVMFKYDASRLDFDIKNGDQVLIVGSISSYIPSGTYQIIIKKIIPFGEGNELLKKEALKKKLENEGIFDESHKLPIPEFPSKISIVTGKNSAAEKDFEFNLTRRNPLVELEFIYAKVQGKEALGDILDALNKAEKSDSDLIILGRGGGASEDLSVFDEEELVRRVYSLKKPIIAAIGHEINLSLVDLASSKHASTPTGACEYAVCDIIDITNELDYLRTDIYKSIKNKINDYESRVNSLKLRKEFTSISSLFDTFLIKLNNLDNSLYLSVLNNINEYNKRINDVKLKLINKDRTSLLKEGYSLIYKDEKLVKNINDIKNGDILKVKSNGGTIDVKVINVNKGE